MREWPSSESPWTFDRSCLECALVTERALAWLLLAYVAGIPGEGRPVEREQRECLSATPAAPLSEQQRREVIEIVLPDREGMGPTDVNVPDMWDLVRR